MKVSKSIEQHIAVFGESGSGKTVLLSSFYGPTQEPRFAKESEFEITPGSAGQGARLFQNYLGMRKDARVPEPNRFASQTYAFNVKPKRHGGGSVTPAQVDGLKLVWHDYPGEWFEQDVEGEEAERRVETFRSLLGSDVAFLLVDAQRLVDHPEQERLYLKSLFTNFRTGLAVLKDDILADGKPLVEFPRIWVVALSKADLLPDLDVWGFRDLVIGEAGAELNHLRETIAEMVDGQSALSVGEDFVRFSSAKFSPERIDLTTRVGLDLILPLAAILPFQRHAHWAEQQAILKIPQAVVDNLADTINAVGVGMGYVKNFALPKPLAAVVNVVSGLFGHDQTPGILNAAQQTLQQARSQALAKKEYIAAILARFSLALIDGEEQRVLLLSRR